MKRAFLIGLALLLLLLPFGCGREESKTVTLQLHEVTRSVFYAPQYIALSKGFFAEEGLNVEITTSGGSEKAMTALLSGEADLCLAGPETGVYVMNEGKADHPVIVGQLTTRDGSFLVAREPSDSFSWDDLVGKTIIGGRAGGMPIMTLRWVMAQNAPAIRLNWIESMIVQFSPSISPLFAMTHLSVMIGMPPARPPMIVLPIRSLHAK